MSPWGLSFFCTIPKAPLHSLSKSTLLPILFINSSIQCSWTCWPHLSILHIPSENYSFYFLWKHFILFWAHVLLLCRVIGTRYTLFVSFSGARSPVMADFKQPYDITDSRTGKRCTQWSLLSQCELTQHTMLSICTIIFSRMNIILWQLNDKLGVRDSFSAERTGLLNRLTLNDTGEKNQCDSQVRPSCLSGRCM